MQRIELHSCINRKGFEVVHIIVQYKVQKQKAVLCGWTGTADKLDINRNLITGRAPEDRPCGPEAEIV